MKAILHTLLVALLGLGAMSGHNGGAVGLSAAQVAQPSAQASGAVRIGVLHDGTYEIVTVPLEQYVSRVLAGEAAPDSPPASLEALAVAIRTYTANNVGRHRAEGFDLCDQTHCQVMRTQNDNTDRAAQATAGQILLYQGKPATVYYSASCGGRTEKPSNVWPGAEDPPYLPIHDDDGCDGFPTWSTDLFDTDLQRALLASGFRGTLRDVRVLTRDQSGRVQRIQVDGMEPREITAQDLRMAVGRVIGFQHIQSTAFDLRRTRQSTHFSGRGSGHGVGLCVIGSMKLAASGQSSTDILARYYPGTQIGPFGDRLTTVLQPSLVEEAPLVLPPVESANAAPVPASPPSAPAPFPVARPDAAASAPPREINDPVVTTDLVIVVPADVAGERVALTALAIRERASVAQALGVTPARVRIRVHETAEQFERASGRPSFQLGALVGDEIQLAPLWLLRERGMLERTLRHQFVHLMADSILPERPAWIREGAAVYFADPAGANTARAACPGDEELRQPVSVGAMGDALGRARACFERQISGGRDWRRVR